MWLYMAESLHFRAKIRFQKVCEYEQEIPQAHAPDQPTASWGRATEPLQ